MGGIQDEHAEWAVINRLKAMIDHPPETKFNVTLGFSLLSTVLLWTKNRMWLRTEDAKTAADKQALTAREKLGQMMIVDAPWNLSRVFPPDHEAGEINGDFITMPAWEFFKWLRDALAHGDGRTIRPLHWHSQDTGKQWLGGFRVAFARVKGSPEILTAHLFKRDLQTLGGILADLFCEHLAQNGAYGFDDEATRHLMEISQ